MYYITYNILFRFVYSVPSLEGVHAYAISVLECVRADKDCGTARTKHTTHTTRKWTTMPLWPPTVMFAFVHIIFFFFYIIIIICIHIYFFFYVYSRTAFISRFNRNVGEEGEGKNGQKPPTPPLSSARDGEIAIVFPARLGHGVER